MKKASSIFLFLVFGCAVVFGQVQLDPRVLVKQAGAVANDLLQWDGTKWAPGRTDVAVVADSAAFRAFNVAIAPKLIVMTDSLRGGKFRRCYSCSADQYMTFSDALSRKWERFDCDFVTPEMFGSRGGTNQDSLPLTRAFNWPKKDVVLTRPYYSSASLTLTEAKTIYGNHATIKLKTVLSASTPNIIINASDARIVDLTIKGLIATQTGEWSAGVQVSGPSSPTNNIILENLNIRDTRGDGIYIATTSVKRGNVNIINVHTNNIMRNGITITAGDNLHIDGFTADSVSLIGIDLEPDVVTQVARNVLIENIHVPSIAFGTHEDTLHKNIVVRNFIIDNSKRGSSVSYADAAIAHKIGVALRGVQNAIFENGTIKNTKLQGIFFSANTNRPCKNIEFNNVFMVDNYTTGTDMWVATEEPGERIKFNNCEFKGSSTYPYFSNVDAEWNNCKFINFGTVLVNFGGVFENCTATLSSRFCYVPATPLTVRNCTITSTEVVVPDGANPPLAGEFLNNTLTLSSSLIGGTVKHNIVTRDNLINGKYYDLVSDGMTIRQTWLVKKTAGAMGITLPKWLGANKDFILVDSVRNGVTTITGDFVGASSFATDGYSSYRFTYSGNVWHPEISSLNTPLSTIRQEGATTGQAITWTGSAWVAGNPTASLSLSNKQIGFGNASNILVGSSRLQFEDTDAAVLLGDGSNNGYKFQMKRTSSSVTTGEETSLYSNNSPTLQRILGGYSNGELSGTSYAEANPAIDVYVPAARYRMFGRVNVAASTAFTSSNVLPILTMMTNTGYAGIGLGYGVDPSTNFHIVGNIRVTGTYKDSNNEDGTAGQILSTTGTGTDWVTPSDNNGIYSGSGTIPNNTNATATDDFTITTADATGTQSPKFRVIASGTDPGVQVWKVGNDSLQLSFIGGEPTLEAIGTSGDFWINSIGNDVRIGNGSTGFFTHTTKNVFGGYEAVPYVQTAASITVSEATQEVDVIGTSGIITLAFDNTSNLLGSAAKTITVRNRGAFNVTLSRGAQSWQWSDMTGTNTASNQTLSPGETAKMLWVDAGATDYYVLHKIPATFTGSASNLAISGTSSPLTVTNSNGTGFTVTAGTNVTLAGTSGNITINATTQQAYATVQEEGSSLTQRTLINFVGSTATAVDNTTKTDVTFDSDVNALAITATTGIYAITGTGTSSTRTITAPAAGITVSNGNGVSGNPTLALANDLSAVEGLSTNGITARTATDTWTTRTITAPAAGITVSNGDGVSGNPTLALANDLSAVEGLSANGVAVRTATDTWTTRTLTAGTGISITNGDGVSGNPTISSTVGGETIISPSNITANQNDWNPTSLSTATIIRLTGDSGFRCITGITAPSADKILRLLNVGSNSVAFLKDNTSSSAANRFDFLKDEILLPGEPMEIYYDLTASRWKMMSHFKTPWGKRSRNMVFLPSATGATASEQWNWASGSGYTTAMIAPLSTGDNRALSLSVGTGTTTTGTGYVATKNLSAYVNAQTGQHTYFGTVAYMPTSSDGTNTFALELGLKASATIGTSVNGVYFRYTHSENSGNWQCVVTTSGTPSVTNTSVAAASGTYPIFEIFRRSNDTVAFYINGALQAAVSYTGGVDLMPINIITKSAGTTNARFETSYIEVESFNK